MEPGEAGPEPRVVMPRFVAEAIGFALRLGWPPTCDSRTLALSYRDGRFCASVPDD